MKPTDPTLIDLTEVVYDLDVPREGWVPALLEAGMPLFDYGLGVVATTYARPLEKGMPAPRKFFLGFGPSDLVERLFLAPYEANQETLRDIGRSGVVTTLSEEGHRVPGGLATFESYIAPAKDLLEITAVDPNGIGLSLAIMLPEVTKLTGRDQEIWQMVGAHLVSGFRLRQGLEEARNAVKIGTAFPNDAEAVIDPKEMRIVDAVGRAAEKTAGEFIREAARSIDRARGRLRREDPEEALGIWRALVEGRWSMVDWFDSDGRRFVLAHANPPDIKDPRGLSERERQVATYAALGETNKLISYRLGISQSTVSTVLKMAMHKLGAQTRPQLVEMLRAFESVE